MAEPAHMSKTQSEQQQPEIARVDVLDQVVMEWARAKIQRLDILNYNGANLAHLHAQDIAKKLGFNPSAIGVAPFPAPVVQAISMEQRQPADPAQTRPPGKLPAWLAALAALVAGSGLTLGGLALANHLTTNSPAGGAAPADSEYDVLFYDKNGRLIDVPRVGAKK